MHGLANFKCISEVLCSCRTKKKEHLLDAHEFQGYKNVVELVWNVPLAERRVDDRRGGAGMTVFKRVSAVGQCGPRGSQMGREAQGM